MPNSTRHQTRLIKAVIKHYKLFIGTSKSADRSFAAFGAGETNQNILLFGRTRICPKICFSSEYINQNAAPGCARTEVYNIRQ